MSVINWKPEYSVGIVIIDEQHKKLFEHINNFYSNINNPYKENYVTLFRSLTNYTIHHFSTEERLMNQYNYKGLPDHKTEHEIFIKKITLFNQRLNEGKLLLSVEITNYLKEWIINHICHTDKNYSSYLISKGVK